ncbi:uncharacterized protein DFL_006961 [Arthrobotrys flagrans]|uniref:Nephrocystin 3-like N-terminal domain-containing protein n=1 Tax=Arthrobotrys flagrans TaxID=97331 RepID=A0A436ZUB4_ARTFL|nr:hypothetical protein DFL_006961 [Arthrobotrys flagrans]
MAEITSILDPMKESVINNTGCRIGFQGTIINHGQINTTDGRYVSEKLKTRKNSVLQKLYKTSYQDQKDRNPDRVPGTCEWFDDVEDQKSVINALCCILHQLFSEKKELLSEIILERFEAGGESFINSFTELWGTLLIVAKDNDSSFTSSETETRGNEIVCVLDAIDECESKGRAQLLKALRKLDGASSALNLKFLLISRPYNEIRHGLIGIPQPQVIRLSGESEEEAEKISREIDVFIKARVEDIGARHYLEPEDEDLLLQKLMGIPNRTYLWVYLTLDLIETDIYTDKIGISEAITQVSRTVNEAYERMLSKSRDFEKAKKLLQIVVAAIDPHPRKRCV